MSYQQGRRIRDTGLKELITQNIVSGQGVGKAIRSSISQSLRAKVTGIKEKFDPLNIAKALTGNLGAAVLGRVTGRSDKDIQYFAGGRRGNYAGNVTQDSDLSAIQPALYTKVAEGQNQRMKKGEGVASVLGKLYNLMKSNYTEEEKRRELDINFKYKQEKQKETWHKELLEAITGIKGTGSATKVTKPKGKGLLDYFDDILEKIKEFFKPALEFIENLKKIFSEKALQLLTRVMSFFEGGALGAALLGVGSLVALGVILNKLSKGLEDKAEDLGGTGALESESEEQTSYATGAADGDMAVLQAVQAQNENKESPADRRVRLIREFQTDVQDFLKPKGFMKVKEDKDGRFFFEDSDGTPPSPEVIKEARAYAQQKQDERKKTGEKKKIQDISPGANIRGEASDARGGQSSSLYQDPRIIGGGGEFDPLKETTAGGATLTPDGSVVTPGGAAMVKPNGIKSASATPMASASPDSTASGGSMSSSASSSSPTPTASMAPPTPNPIGERAQNAMAQNTDLQMKESQPKVINIDNSKNITSKSGSKGSDIVFDTSIPVRTDDPTLQKVQKQNLRMV